MSGPICFSSMLGFWLTRTGSGGNVVGTAADPGYGQFKAMRIPGDFVCLFRLRRRTARSVFGREEFTSGRCHSQVSLSDPA